MEKTTFFLRDREQFRRLGRCVFTADGLRTDFSASGVEFRLTCKGPFLLTAHSESRISTRYRVYVDGKRGECVAYFGGTGTQLAFPNIAEGEHTIRILKDGVVARGENDLLISFTVDAEPDSIRPTEQRPLLIECVGDSVVGASGTWGPGPTVRNSSSAGLSFPLLAADLLGADCRMVNRGGLGYVTKTDGVDVQDLYFLENAYLDGEKPYDFAGERKPDAVVLHIGVNDRETEEVFYPLLTAFIRRLRAAWNDETLKIVLLYNTVGPRHAASYLRCAKETDSVWALCCAENREGYVNHPSAEAQRADAVLLSQFLRILLDLDGSGK